MIKDLQKYYTQNFKTIVYVLFLKIFGNTYINSLINIIVPILLSVLLAIPTDKRSLNFNNYVFILIIFVVLFNILYDFASHLKNKNEKWKNLLNSVTKHISAIHIETGTNIYRMNKHTKNSIECNQLIDKTHFNQLVDFQEVSFLVCKSIYDIITEDLECDECEVTVYQKFPKEKNKKYNTVKMIAYATKDRAIPSTYNVTYNINKNSPKTIFMSIFKQNKANTIIFHKQKIVRQNFVMLQGSEDREQMIHQYIGIPIKTNSNNVVCVLQIDVPRKNYLGKIIKRLNFSQTIF